MRNGTKGLRIASVIQILLGVASIFITYYLIGEATASDINMEGEQALFILLTTYGAAFFQILAGLLGLLLAKKKSLLTLILGVLLFLPQLIHFIKIQDNITLIIINAILLVIPYYYLHSAYKNFKQS